MAKATFEDFMVGDKHYDKQEFLFEVPDIQLSKMLYLLFRNATRMVLANIEEGLPLTFFDGSKLPKKEDSDEEE